MFLDAIINFMNQQLNPLSGKNNFLANPKKNGFTLVELIIVVIIVGILASLGLTQYSLMVEKSRTAEARVHIGTMRNLAYSYYLENGSLTGIQNGDLGVNATCTSNSYYYFAISSYSTASMVGLVARRCESGGKPPNASSATVYRIYMFFTPSTGETLWRCNYVDGLGPCFGYSNDIPPS
jgi:prepilin-type N-terminal cleavage/methylation domain-containing protein